VEHLQRLLWGWAADQVIRKRECSGLGRTSEPLLGHVVGKQCDGEASGVQNCDSGPCTPMGPGVQLINGISGIFGNLGSVILAPAGCPVDGCPAEGDEEGTCISTCEDWPYSQCRVELRRPDGSWQAATCLNPYTTKPGPFNPFPQKFTNYPECGQIPTGCKRCDDECAWRDGKAGRKDY